MRVTSRMMQSTYLKNVNALTQGTQNSLNQLSSGMKLFKASENTAAAVKAYQVRTSLNRNEGYTSNLEHADAVLTSSETVLMGVEDILKEAKAKIVQGLNGTTNPQDRTIIAGELRSIQDQILQAMNSNDSGFYIFGGSNTDSKPFGVTEDNHLTYNGKVLGQLPNDAADGKKADEVAVLSDDSLYLDIGLAPEFDENDNVIKNTVFEYSITGIDVMGYGTTALTDKSGKAIYQVDADGNKVIDPATGDPVQYQASSNLYDIIGEIAAELERPDGIYSVDRGEALYAIFERAVDTVTTQLTNIGAKTSYIEYSTNRIDTLDINLSEKQSQIEDVDYAEAYTTYSSLYTSYQAALQVGSKIIGPSLFDYL